MIINLIVYSPFLVFLIMLVEYFESYILQASKCINIVYLL